MGRLAKRPRAESWSHAGFLVACLHREVSARDSHGGEGQIRAARFPAGKALEEFTHFLDGFRPQSAESPQDVRGESVLPHAGQL